MNVRMLSADVPGTLLDSLTAGADMRGAVRVGAVALFAVMTAAASQVSVPVPFTLVPFTLTPLVVLLGGAAMGARLGMAAQLVYLTAGIMGLPVFAASAVLPPGPLRLIGPTGGYLMAYPLAAFVTGYLAERGFDRRYATSVLAMSAGLAVIFAFGVSWLALFARPAATGFAAALSGGLYPFLPADLFKICVAAAVMPAIWRLLGRRV